MDLHTTDKIREDIKEMFVKENTFSADQLIEAWSKGVQEGCGIPNILIDSASLLVQSTKIIIDFYNNNLSKTGCFSVFMRFIPNKVNFIAAINKDVYLDDDACRPIYMESAKITQKNLCVTISFIPCTDSESVNVASLNADNYMKIM